MESRRKSNIKKLRKSGFRARMRTHKGRKTISRKRRAGRSLNVRTIFRNM
jgi:large subunit ribosomal protein L34